MVTFGFNKSVDDIEAPDLMPEDWYDFEIEEDPKITRNNALNELIGEDPSDEEIEAALEEDPKAGFNLTIRLISEHPSDVYNGRQLTLWRPWPRSIEATRFNNKGQKVYDAKMEACVAFVKAFGGVAEGDMISITQGLKGQCYVVQRDAFQGDGFENSIDRFSGFKPYGS